MTARGTRAEALHRLYTAINHPVRAGRNVVQYERAAIVAALDVLKQLLVAEGFEFRTASAAKLAGHAVHYRSSDACCDPIRQALSRSAGGGADQQRPEPYVVTVTVGPPSPALDEVGRIPVEHESLKEGADQTLSQVDRGADLTLPPSPPATDC